MIRTRDWMRPLAGSWRRRRVLPTAPWCRQGLTVGLGTLSEVVVVGGAVRH